MTPRSLHDAPALPAWQWRRYIHADAGRSLLCLPAIWILYPIPGDDPIWMPCAPADMETGVASARPVFAAAGVSPQDRILVVAPPAPWAGNMLPYLFSASDRLLPEATRGGPNVFPLSLTSVEYKADLAAFPLSMSPSVIAGSPDDIDTLLQVVHAAGLEFPRFRLALLNGPEPPDPRAADLAAATAQLLYVPGLFAPVGGRPGETGVILPADRLVAEVILDAEWGRSVQDPGRLPLVHAAAVGETGELVVTVSNAALPVVRLRTALRIRVEDATAAGARVVFVTRPTPPPAAAGMAAFTPAARR